MRLTLITWERQKRELGFQLEEHAIIERWMSDEADVATALKTCSAERLLAFNELRLKLPFTRSNLHVHWVDRDPMRIGLFVWHDRAVLNKSSVETDPLIKAWVRPQETLRTAVSQCSLLSVIQICAADD